MTNCAYCPYCSELVELDLWNVEPEDLEDGGQFKQTCGHCAKRFMAHVSIHYATERADCLNEGAPHDLINARHWITGEVVRVCMFCGQLELPEMRRA